MGKIPPFVTTHGKDTHDSWEFYCIPSSKLGSFLSYKHQWFISLPSLTKRLCRLDAGSFCWFFEKGCEMKIAFSILPVCASQHLSWSKNWKQGTILDKTNGQNASRWSEKPSRVVQVYTSDFERSQKNPISVQVNKDRRCHTVFILAIFWAFDEKSMYPKLIYSYFCLFWLKV